MTTINFDTPTLQIFIYELDNISIEKSHAHLYIRIVHSILFSYLICKVLLFHFL